MASINRYYQPSDYEYVSQYTPIPFEQLYKLGQVYGAQREKAEKDMLDYSRKIGEFQSLIKKDVDNYYKIAMNPQIQELYKEAASNIDNLKSAEWRSRLNSAISNADYASLAKLRQSAESAKAYDDMYKKLAAQGLMGPEGWEPNYFDTYDTLARDAVFSATPLAYQSVNAVVKPYVDNIKDSYLYTKGGYDYVGVSPDTAEAQVRARSSDILANPQIQRHIQILTQRGLDPQTATQAVLEQAATAAREFKRENREANPYSMLEYQMSLRERLENAKQKAKRENASGTIITRVTQNQAAAQQRANEYYSNEANQLANSTFGVNYNDLDQNSKAVVDAGVAGMIRAEGLNNSALSTLPKSEYFDYYGNDKSSIMTLTNKDDVAVPSTQGESYTYRPSDTVFTVDGKSLIDIPKAFVSVPQSYDTPYGLARAAASAIFGNSKQLDDPFIVIDNVLKNISSSKAIFSPNGSATIYNDSPDLNPNANVVKALGKLYVTEDDLENAIELAYPDDSGTILSLFKNGYKESEDSRTAHKILKKVKGYKLDGEDVYEISFGRNYGSEANLNARVNEDRLKEIAGTTTVSKTQPQIQGYSQLESSSNWNE